MLFSIFEPEIKSASVLAVPGGGFTLGFTLGYKTASSSRNDAHLAVDQIPHPGKPSELIQWEETYILKPGVNSGHYGVLTQSNQSLVANRVVLTGKTRRHVNGMSVQINEPVCGVLSDWLGDNQNFTSIFADGALGDKLTKQLLRAIAELKHPSIRALDAGVYTLFAPNLDESFFPHHASFNTKTVATFTQFGLNLNFRLAESVLVEYDLSVDTTDEMFYLDAEGRVVSPNFFSWLSSY